MNLTGFLVNNNQIERESKNLNQLTTEKILTINPRLKQNFYKQILNSS